MKILGTTLRRAHRAAKRDGRTRFVYANYNGFVISLMQPPQQSYWTNGRDAGRWGPRAAKGTVIRGMADALSGKGGVR